MPKPLVADELWAVVEALLPKEPPKPKGGRPRIDDRAALTRAFSVRAQEDGHPLGDAFPRDGLAALA
jgi:transposase